MLTQDFRVFFFSMGNCFHPEECKPFFPQHAWLQQSSSVWSAGNTVESAQTSSLGQDSVEPGAVYTSVCVTASLIAVTLMNPLFQVKARWTKQNICVFRNDLRGKSRCYQSARAYLVIWIGYVIEKLLVELLGHKAVFLRPIMLPYYVTVCTSDDGKFSVTDAKRCKYLLYFVHSDEKLWQGPKTPFMIAAIW